MSARALLLVALLCSCDHAPEALLGPSRDLRGAPAPELPPPVLAEWPLRTHADYDALEAAFEARASLPDLASLLLGVAERRGDDALLLGRVALLWLDGRAGERSLKLVFDLVDKVRALAPDAADTRYLLLEVKRAVVWDAAGRSASVPGGQEDIARRFLEDVDALLSAAPDYVGPGGVTAATLRVERAAVASTLERGSAESPPGATADGTPLDQDEATLWRSWAAFVVTLEASGSRKACNLAHDVLAADPPGDIAALVRARCPGAH
ncbi:MAG: hypothetical protein AMXMBFR64_06650 [Myxococcales bacterium]